MPADHPAWPLEARYLALGIANFIFTLSPQRIIVGGGVMVQHGLLATVRREVAVANQALRRLDNILPDILGDMIVGRVPPISADDFTD